MDDQIAKAFDFTQDTTKQLPTLATAITALSITFVKDFAASASPVAKAILALSWLFYLLSILSGMLTLMALTGTLENVDAERQGQLQAQATIRGGNVTRPAVAQALLFFVGLVLTVTAGIISV